MTKRKRRPEKRKRPITQKVKPWVTRVEPSVGRKVKRPGLPTRLQAGGEKTRPFEPALPTVSREWWREPEPEPQAGPSVQPWIGPQGVQQVVGEGAEPSWGSALPGGQGGPLRQAQGTGQVGVPGGPVRGGGGPPVTAGPPSQAWAGARRRIGEAWAGVEAPAEPWQLPGALGQMQENAARQGGEPSWGSAVPGPPSWIRGMRPPQPWARAPETPTPLQRWVVGPASQAARELGAGMRAPMPLVGAALHDVGQLPGLRKPSRAAAAAGKTALEALQLPTSVVEETLARSVGQRLGGIHGLPPLTHPEKYLTAEDRKVAEQVARYLNAEAQLVRGGGGPPSEKDYLDLNKPGLVMRYIAAQGVLTARRLGAPSMQELAEQQYGAGPETEMGLAKLAVAGGYSSYEAQRGMLPRLMAGEPIESVTGGMSINTREPTQEEKEAFNSYVAGVRAADGPEAAEDAAQAVLETGRIPGGSDLWNEILFQSGLDPLNLFDLPVWAGKLERAREGRAVARVATRVDDAAALRQAQGAARRAVAAGVSEALQHGQDLPAQGGRSWIGRLWKRINPFELTPMAKAQQSANGAYQVGSLIIEHADGPEEAKALVRALADNPGRLVDELGSVPASQMAREAQPVFREVLGKLDDMQSLRKWDRWEFVSELSDAMLDAAKTLEGVPTTAAEAAAAKSGYRRFADGFRHTMSEFYLRTPGYAIANATSDLTTMATDGVLSLDGVGEIDDFLKRIGPTTRRIAGATGGQQVMAQGSKLPGALGRVSETAGRWISRQEEGRYKRAFYSVLTDSLERLWRPKLPGDLAAQVARAYGPDAVQELEGALRRGRNLDEFRAVVGKLDNGEPLVNVARYLDDPNVLSVGMRVELEPKLEQALVGLPAPMQAGGRREAELVLGGPRGARSGAELGLGARSGGPRGAEVEARIDDVIDGARETVRQSTGKAFAGDPTPPGRMVWSNNEAAQDLAEEQGMLEALGRAAGVSEEEAAQQTQTLADVLAPGEREMRHAEEQMLATVRAGSDDIGQTRAEAAVIQAARADTGMESMRARAAADELRARAWAEVKRLGAEGKQSGVVWEGYFPQISELRLGEQETNIRRLQAAGEQLKRVQAGETFEAVMGRPAQSVMDGAVDSLRSLARDLGTRQAKLVRLGVEEFGDFDKTLDAMRLTVDLPEAETWRLVKMNPTRDTLDVVTSTQQAVDRMGRGAAEEAAAIRSRFLAGKINREKYGELVGAVWGDGFFKQGAQAWDLTRGQVAALPMSPGAQKRALQAMGWPVEKIEQLTSGQMSSVLRANVRWDAMLDAPEMPLAEAVQGSMMYVAEQAGLDITRAANWTPAEWESLGMQAQVLAKEAGDRASTARRMGAAAVEEAAQQAARRPQTVQAGMDIVYPSSVDDIARVMGMQPQQMRPDDWARVADFAHERGAQAWDLGDEIARKANAWGERGGVTAWGQVGGQGREVRWGGHTRKWVGERITELKGESREQAKALAQWLLEQSGYEPRELERLNLQQRTRLLQEVAQGDVLVKSSGAPVTIGPVAAQRRYEIINGASDQVRRTAASWGGQPEEAMGYRWLELAEEATRRTGRVETPIDVGQIEQTMEEAAKAGRQVWAYPVGGAAPVPLSQTELRLWAGPDGELVDWKGVQRLAAQDGEVLWTKPAAEAVNAEYVAAGPGLYDSRGYPVMRPTEGRAERRGPSTQHAVIERMQGMVPGAEQRGLGKASVGFEQRQAWLAERYVDVQDMAKARGQLMKSGTRTGRGALVVPTGVVKAQTRKEMGLYTLDLLDEERRVLRSYSFDNWGEAKTARTAARQVIKDGRQGQAHLVSTDWGAWRVEDVLGRDKAAAARGGYAEAPTMADMAQVMEGEQLRALEQIREGMKADARKWGERFGGAAEGGKPSWGSAIPGGQGAAVPGGRVWTADELERAATLRRAGGKGDPLTARRLSEWVDGDLARDWTTTKGIGVEMARDGADFALLDYTKQRRGDVWANLIYPYTFWKTRSGRNFALRAMERPGAVAAYVRYQRGMERANEEAGRRSRFEGSVGIPAGGVLPEWMGKVLFYNPSRGFFPWAQIVGQGYGDDPADAENALDALLRVSSKLGLRPYGYIEWGVRYFGWAGDKGDIGYILPQTGMAQAATAGLREAGIGTNVIPPGGMNIEAGLRRGLGAPEAEPYTGYRRSRMISDMAAVGTISTEAALLAQELQRLVETGELAQAEAEGWERGGENTVPQVSENLRRIAVEQGWTPEQVAEAQMALQEATQRAGLERGVTTAGSFMAGQTLRVLPTGEQGQLELQGQERGTMYSPLTGTGSREAMLAWQKEHPEALTRRMTSSAIDAGEYSGWTPGEALQSRTEGAERERINAEYDERKAELLRQRPWDSAGAAALEQERYQALDSVQAGAQGAAVPGGQGAEPGVEAGRPSWGSAIPGGAAEEYRPRSVWGASPVEAERIRRDEVLAAVSAAMPRRAEFEGEEGAAQYEEAVRAFFADAPVRMAGDVRLGALRQAQGTRPEQVDAWVAGIGKGDVERYWRRNDTPLEALQRVWGDEVYGKTFDAYGAALERGMDSGEAYERYVEGAGPTSGTALIDAVLKAYPDRGWTPQELQQEYQGVEFPGVGEAADLRKPPEERALAEAQDGFWRALDERLPPGRMSRGAREYPLVQLVLDAETRGTATTEQYQKALDWLESWRAGNVSEEWLTPADWQEARALNEEWTAEAERALPGIDETLGAYYDLSQAERRAYKAEHPEIGTYFDMRDAFGAEPGHEIWAYFYLGGASTLRQAQGTTGSGYGARSTRRSYRRGSWGGSRGGGQRFYGTKYPAKMTLERPDPWGSALRFERYRPKGVPWVVKNQTGWK